MVAPDIRKKDLRGFLSLRDMMIKCILQCGRDILQLQLASLQEQQLEGADAVDKVLIMHCRTTNTAKSLLHLIQKLYGGDEIAEGTKGQSEGHCGKRLQPEERSAQ